MAKLSFLSRLTIGEEKQFLVENLAMLLSSGIGVIAALDAISQELKSKELKKIIDQVSQRISDGSYMWEALKETGLFPEHIISLIEIGEESGRLPENLQIVSEQLEKDRNLKARLQSALTYPVLVMSVTVIVGVGVAWFILPKLSTIFDQVNLDLPLPTRILIFIGTFLQNYGYWVIPLFLLLFVIIIYFLFVNKSTRHLSSELGLKVPTIRKLVMQVELSRFGFILGNLLQAGLPVINAFDSLYEATTIPSYRKIYALLRSEIEDGKSFEEAFTKSRNLYKYIPISVQQIIIAGEQSGNLAETLIKVSKMYEEKSETTTKDLTVILEPILLVIVWLGVVMVAVAVIMPIYSLIGGLNNNI